LTTEQDINDRDYIRTSMYQAIRLWNQNTGAMNYYIRQVQEDAARDNAPAHAIYAIVESCGKRWRTVDDLPEQHSFRFQYNMHLLDWQEQRVKK
jgi:hypothetical protein